MNMLPNGFRIALALTAFALLAPSAHAATLSFTNASGSVGRTLTVSVLVSAEGGESLNGVSTRVNFPADKLELLSISKAGSIITFWAEEPSFSNAAGTASLEGIVPNPGYSGQGGRVITLVFQAQAPGAATISFGNASVLANDGQGTNILTGAFSRTLSLSAAPTVEPTPALTPTPASPTKPKPAVPAATRAVHVALSTSTTTQAALTATTSTTSEPVSNLINIAGKDRSFTDWWGWNVPIFILAFLGLIALGILGYYGWPILVGKLREKDEKRNLVKDSFGLLTKDLESEISRLRRHTDALSEKERAFLEQFESDLKEVEKLVEKRIRP